MGRGGVGVCQDPLEGLDQLEEPLAASPNSASNPPAAYWKRLWLAWQYLKADVEKGLKTLTGQTFATAKEAKEWAKTKEARDAGTLYKSGS